MREATIKRITGETQIELTLNLDGEGKCNVENPIGFFNHLLMSFCKHGLFDLSGSIKGDLDVDQHHTIEDTGIVLGQCFAKALGDCAGIFRSGSFLYPMDESLLRAAVDFGGRPFLVCNAELTGIPLVSEQDGKQGRGEIFGGILNDYKFLIFALAISAIVILLLVGMVVYLTKSNRENKDDESHKI